MKVCTDACLFGAFVANSIPANMLPVAEANCLEIGAGTGLLSLMYAQKNLSALIDAIEIEAGAFEQAQHNFSQSKWNARLKIFHTDAKEFTPGKKYDLIICNPPFYENELLSGDKNKNIAMHDEGLTLKELIGIIKTHLAAPGYFAVLLPWQRIQYFRQLAEKESFFLHQQVLIRQTPLHHFFRGILVFSNNNHALKTEELVIKNNNGNYSDEFTTLLKDYYLKL